MLEAILTSTAVVALAEIGDKTMLLAIVLSARLRAPGPIIAGIFAATIVNHAMAAWVGQEAAWLLDARWFRIAVALGFIGIGLWTLVPDKLDDDDTKAARSRGGPFLTTLVSFFLVEMGDKTQIATIALAAHYRSVAAVATGTTIGMLLANVPAVLMGDALIRRVSLRVAHGVAAALFIALGAWQLASLFGLAG